MVVKGSKVVNATGEGGRSKRCRWLYGINALARRLEVNPRSILEVYALPRPSGRRSMVVNLAAAAGLPVRRTDEATLRRLTGSTAHQGVAALAEPFQYADLAAVLAGTRGPLLLLDQIQDPHNLGALIRTAAAVGMAAVVMPRHGAVAVSASVEKVAAGAVNDTLVCQVTNICRSLTTLRSHGYWSIALVPRAGQDLFAMEMPEQPALVLGGEGGLRPLVEESCDFRASIPLKNSVESLNASVAGAIAMYEVARRGLTFLDRGTGGW